jgi:hypothetical protein
MGTGRVDAHTEPAPAQAISEAESTVQAAWAASLAVEENEAAAVLRDCRRLYRQALAGVRAAQLMRDPVQIAAAHLVLAEADEMLQDCITAGQRLHASVTRQRSGN